MRHASVDGVVSTGAAMLMLPQNIVERLGLPIHDTVTVSCVDALTHDDASRKDRLPSVIEDGLLWRDAEVAERSLAGTTIGIGEITQRRMSYPLRSHPTLTVGECVPFYFCPRSVMLLLARGAMEPSCIHE